MQHIPASESNEIQSKIASPLLNLEKYFLSHRIEIETWFRHQWKQTIPPFYGSVDLRNSGYKIAPVDTNLFPAGFNNLNPNYMSLYVQAVQATITEICPDVTRILVIPESHTRNLYYFESVATLQELLTQAGLSVRLGSLDTSLSEPASYETPSGKKITIEPLIRKEKQIGVKDFFPCCILLNNDLSEKIPDILRNLDQKIMPPIELSWACRLKSEHFRFYEQVSQEFSEHFSFDPWLITPWFDQCPEVNFMKKEGEQCLVKRADALMKRIHKKFTEYNIDQKPFLVVKADQGTYGMAVMMIRDPEELTRLNRKQRTRMSTIKGGMPVTRAIVQEGVYTNETFGENQGVAEPVVYLMGRHVIGGFYRVHGNRGPDENLNAPGMNFQPLPFAKPCNIACEDLADKANQFYIYGVVSRLAMLAAARELAVFRGKKE